MYAIRSYYVALAYKWYLLAFEANLITLRHFHYYLVYSEYLTNTQISEGQKLAKEHLAIFGTSNRITSYNVCYTKLLRSV